MPLIDSMTDVDGTLLEAHVPEEAFVWTKHPDSVAGGFIVDNGADCFSNFGRMWYSGNIARVDAGGAFEIEADIEIVDPPVAAQVSVWLLEDPDLFTGYELLLNVFGGGPQELVGLSSHENPADSVTVAPFGAPQAPVAGLFTLKLRKDGDLITGYWKGVEVASFSNSEYPNITAIGIRYNGGALPHNYLIKAIVLPDFVPPPFGCFPTDYTDVADPALATGFACPVDPVVATCTEIDADNIIVLDDACIPQGTVTPVLGET